MGPGGAAVGGSPRAELALSIARVASLGAVLFGVSQQLRGVHLVAGATLGALAGTAWLAWLVSRRRDAPLAVTWVALAVMAAAGGALAALAPFAICFVAVAALGAAVAAPPARSVGIAVLGVAGLVIAAGAASTPHRAELTVEVAASAVAGLMAGAARRQYVERADQAELLLVERLRADEERDHAAALAERNRLGRELHDVLAHSLGALTVQLDAAAAVFDAGDLSEGLRLVRDARGLAAEGLDEARRAVRALRDPLRLGARVAALAAREGATLTVAGDEDAELPEGVQLALYRSAQEALSNARKHAPGAHVAIHLDVRHERAELVVTNGSPSARDEPLLASSGGGYGLRGMRERLEQLGGTCSAGPAASGWEVRVAVPR